MMARPKLTQLLGDTTPASARTESTRPVEPQPVQSSATLSATPEVIVAAPAERPAQAAGKKKALIDSVETSRQGAHYLTFVRKETRLREDQMDALAAKARQINRHKTDGGERVTDNTLIRIAVDLLLAKADNLAGSTENELRNSVSS